MSDQPHLELDQLADVLAEQSDPQAVGHVHSCPRCAASLARLAASDAAVSALLAEVPSPPLPAGLGERLEQALARAQRLSAPGRAVGVLPVAGRRPVVPRLLGWAGGLVAAAVVLVAGGLLLHGQEGSSTSSKSSSSSLKAVPPGIPTSVTGTDYGRDRRALAAALPGLLRAAPRPAAARSGDAPVAPRTPAVPAGLARLSGAAGLAGCLAALTDPADRALPLALDYARFAARPALVVVLPSGRSGRLDVFVVGAGCGRADAQVRYYTRLAAPG